MPYVKNCPAQTKNEQPKAKRTIDQPYFLLEVNFNGCTIYMRINYSQITLSSDVAYDGKEVRNE